MENHVALTRCFYCNEPNEILLAKHFVRLSTQPGWTSVPDMSKYQDKVIDMRPCPKCEGYMKQGIILISIDEAKSGKDWNKAPTDAEDRKHWMPNPWRTGGFFVLKEEAIRRMFGHNTRLIEKIIKSRWTFIEHAAAEKIGLLQAKPTNTETNP